MLASQYVTQTGLELMIFQPQPSKYWVYSSLPLQWGIFYFELHFITFNVQKQLLIYFFMGKLKHRLMWLSGEVLLSLACERPLSLICSRVNKTKAEMLQRTEHIAAHSYQRLES